VGLAALAALAVLAGCPAPREVTPPPSPTPVHPPPSAALEPGATATASQPTGPLLAEGTLPQGLAPLTPAERAEADDTCRRLRNRLDRRVRDDKHQHTMDEYIEEIMRESPRVPGLDVRRCAALFLRSERVEGARVIEREAIDRLRRLSGGIARAGRLCPAAAPVPASLAGLDGGMVTTRPEDWGAPGYRCAGFVEVGPQRYQYELTADEAAQTFEIVARGFPVPGAEAVELYVRGEVKDGRVRASDVLRR
jgi:hypothetical protein